MADLSEEIKRYIDIALRSSGRSEIDRSLSTALWGINTNGNSSMASGPDDTQGLIFVARPDCLLNDPNLSQHRVMSNLLASEEWDTETGTKRIVATQTGAIRSLLDRRSCMGKITKISTYGKATSYAAVASPLIDPYNTWIALFTNQAVSLSGFPDSIANTKVSAEGAYGQQHIMSDARSDNYGNFKLTLTLDETRGRMVASIFAYWFLYMALLRDGRNTRWPANEVNHRLDYNTRIFHIALNRTKNKVTGIYDATICIPMGMNDGEVANYDSTIETPETGSKITVQFECIGAAKYDPISRIEFNRMVSSSKWEMYYQEDVGKAQDLTNAELYMDAFDTLTANGMTLLSTPMELAFFDGRGYPRIDADMNMQWWVDSQVYQDEMARYKEVMEASIKETE